MKIKLKLLIGGWWWAWGGSRHCSVVLAQVTVTTMSLIGLLTKSISQPLVQIHFAPWSFICRRQVSIQQIDTCSPLSLATIVWASLRCAIRTSTLPKATTAVPVRIFVGWLGWLAKGLVGISHIFGNFLRIHRHVVGIFNLGPSVVVKINTHSFPIFIPSPQIIAPHVQAFFV